MATRTVTMMLATAIMGVMVAATAVVMVEALRTVTVATAAAATKLRWQQRWQWAQTTINSKQQRKKWRSWRQRQHQ
jgi:hypothetical protein